MLAQTLRRRMPCILDDCHMGHRVSSKRATGRDPSNQFGFRSLLQYHESTPSDYCQMVTIIDCRQCLPSNLGQYPTPFAKISDT